MTDTYLSYDELHALLTGVLRAGGYSAAHAAAIAHTMSKAERDQCRSRGIYRLAGVLKSRRAGLATGEKAPVINDAADRPITKIDAGGEFAPLASAQGLPLLAAKARRYGLAALAINNCLHLAALWPEVEALAHQGLGALAMCPSNAYVAPAGGIRKLFGTNPLAFGWPTGDDRPYVFDFATSVIARGEVELYRLDNKPLPDGWGIDRDGQPSNDAAAVLDDGALLPFGGYKGSAIATMIELLAAVWIGDLLSSRGLAPLHGELIIAINPAAFGAVDYASHSRALLDAIRDQGARLPSQRRYAARASAATRGIPISADNLDKLQRMEKGELDLELH